MAWQGKVRAQAWQQEEEKRREEERNEKGVSKHRTSRIPTRDPVLLNVEDLKNNMNKIQKKDKKGQGKGKRAKEGKGRQGKAREGKGRQRKAKEGKRRQRRQGKEGKGKNG